ncbi:hypothetical protein P5E48_11510 [Clostridium perfringens]|nr:hypothetical protein [Clostridium perfringens]MDK0793857.1 hypothetical protein [Clostridium perfringens]
MLIHDYNKETISCYCGKGQIILTRNYYCSKRIGGIKSYTCTDCQITNIKSRIDNYHFKSKNLEKLKNNSERIKEDNPIYKYKDILKVHEYFRLPKFKKYKTKKGYYQELINYKIINLFNDRRVANNK